MERSAVELEYLVGNIHAETNNNLFDTAIFVILERRLENETRGDDENTDVVCRFLCAAGGAVKD
jgi:hypothetical protein